MPTYYNEFDPYAAEWLRCLIAAGLIAPGDVDERSITEVNGDDLIGYTQCHFFAGIGGWSLALRMAGVDDDEPIWTGSCPCQPFSQAGKHKGIEDERHLWPEFHRLIEERRPSAVLGEQVASKDGREWLTGVFTDLERVGYAGAGVDLCSASIGAPHIRQRLYWVAHSDHTGPQGRSELRECPTERFAWASGVDNRRRRIEPGTLPLAHGLPRSVGDGSTRSDRMALMAAKAWRKGTLRGYGNAIDPRVAAEFIRAALT